MFYWWWIRGVIALVFWWLVLPFLLLGRDATASTWGRAIFLGIVALSCGIGWILQSFFGLPMYAGIPAGYCIVVFSGVGIYSLITGELLAPSII